MYERILLAYDGSLEGAVALREGAILARRVGAQVFVLSVVPGGVGAHVAEAAHGGAVVEETGRFQEILDRGVSRLIALGMKPKARLVFGDPAKAIGGFSREIGADLVVVGHRKRSMLERWWSGPTGAYISDHVRCSVMIARNVVSDAAFEEAMRASAPGEEVAP
ncbi:MAG: universal stress protein [Caulobacteraceae bacterium]